MPQKIRTQFLIKPAFQLGIIFQIASILVMFIALLITFMYFIAHENIPILESSLIRKQFEDGISHFIYRLVAVGGSVLVTAFFIGVYVTHKIAGSLFAIERYLDQLLEGNADVEDLKLRKNSELQNLADKINQLKKKLPKK